MEEEKPEIPLNEAFPRTVPRYRSERPLCQYPNHGTGCIPHFRVLGNRKLASTKHISSHWMACKRTHTRHRAISDGRSHAHGGRRERKCEQNGTRESVKYTRRLFWGFVFGHGLDGRSRFFRCQVMLAEMSVRIGCCSAWTFLPKPIGLRGATFGKVDEKRHQPLTRVHGTRLHPHARRSHETSIMYCSASSSTFFHYESDLKRGVISINYNLV